MPIPVLDYTYPEYIMEGSLVRIPIKTKLYEGIVIKRTLLESLPHSQNKNTKQIKEIIPFCFSRSALKFLKFFSVNTFNSYNQTAQSFWQPFKLLRKSDWKQMSANFADFRDLLDKSNNLTHSPHKNLESGVSKGFKFYLDYYYNIRIMILIRTFLQNNLQKNQKNKKLLIIFPEKKSLNQFLNYWDKFIKNPSQEIFRLQDQPNEIGNLDQQDFDRLVTIFKSLEFWVYFGDYSMKSKHCLRQIIFTSYNQKEYDQKKDQNDSNSDFPSQNIILGSRSAIFLPFQDLEEIILVDEANSFYIQDQNSIYYDTRDAVFFLSKAYQCKLNFVSTLPSIRLYSFYSEEVLDKLTTSSTAKGQKSLKIKVNRSNKKFDDSSLFSNQLRDYLQEGLE